MHFCWHRQYIHLFFTYMQNIQKIHVECQPGKICTKVHGFQTVLSYVKTARRLKQPVDAKWQMMSKKWCTCQVSMVFFQNPRGTATEFIWEPTTSWMKNDENNGLSQSLQRASQSNLKNNYTLQTSRWNLEMNWEQVLSPQKCGGVYVTAKTTPENTTTNTHPQQQQ